jgi:hypothetical protein
MAIVLTTLKAVGVEREDAEISFNAKRQVIRGPSETGKSYIRDCLWYMLGGEKPPKSIPLAAGYQELQLRLVAEDQEYEIRRGLSGGNAAIFSRSLDNLNAHSFEPLEDDLGELLVKLSSAAGKQILRNQSDRGPVTGDDLRHWSLWSQTDIPGENPTSGQGYATTKRISSFNLFLSGTDDAAIQVNKTKAEVDRIKGQLTSAEAALDRTRSGLPDGVKREDVVDALERVDRTLAAMTTQYEARSTLLKQLRRDIGDTSDLLTRASNSRNHAKSMVARFELLEQKYSNDLERLGATSEGVAFFQELPNVPCPLCGTPTEMQVDPQDLTPSAPAKYREAIAAEADKIRGLRSGLLTALRRETLRYEALKVESERLVQSLSGLQSKEALAIEGSRIEFNADPKTLAFRRSDLTAQLAIFDEIERLTSEIARLKASSVRKRLVVNRDGGIHGRAVADRSKALLELWGFTDIENIALDAEECDLRINDRPRLSYGAGRRALYLASLAIALMEHALQKGHPHLGVVVIDSPLKAYADPRLQESTDVPLAKVTDNFYAWLSTWSGSGQIIILENEEVREETAKVLAPIEFSGIPRLGRSGFFPHREVSQSQGDLEASNDAGGTSDSGEDSDW